MWAAKHVYLRYPSGQIHSLIEVGALDDVNNMNTTAVGRQLYVLPQLHSGMQLVFEVGAYDSIYAGLWQAPRLGAATQMLRNDTRKKALTAGIATTLLLFAALNMALWRVGYHSQAMMVLPLAALCLAVRQINDAGLTIDLFPAYTAAQDATVSWLTYLIGIATGFFYMLRRFSDSIPPWAAWPPILLSLVGVALLLQFDTTDVQQFGKLHRPLVGLCALLLFWFLIRRSSLEGIDNKLTLLGIALIVAALAIDIIHYHLYATGFLIPVNSFAWIFFIGSQIYLLSWRYHATMQRNIKLNTELSELNQHLEQRIQQRTLELNEKNQQLEQLYKTDALTALPNRRALADFAAQEFARLKRHPGNLSVALIDIDFFKMVNDQYGHQAGDETLKAVARFLQSSLREVDMAARWGGEEFCVLFPGIDQHSALRVMERIRTQLQDLCIETGEGHRVQITISTGIADTEQPVPLEKLIANADRALYQAKSRGRNCSLCWDAGTATGTEPDAG